MTPYPEFLEELKGYAEEEYAAFHGKLLKNDKINVIGVRVPILRKLAAKYRGEAENLLTFPDDYYEVTFVKLSVVAMLPYDEFVKNVEKCVGLLDNWATCDCFAPVCVKDSKEEFLPFVRKFAADGREFVQRFAFTTLLHFYVEERYLEVIFSLCERADTSKYYVHMAVAWLVAECLVKYYSRTVGFLSDCTLDKKTHNKAITKALESFRLSNDRKNYIKGLKR